jgi:acetyltransferase-like isoleucine patch superfamily enzyme
VIIKASVGEVTMMNYKVYKNVKIGKGVEIGDFAIIGLPLSGAKEGEQETIIEDGATIGSHSVVYAGARLGQNFRCGHGVVIGENMAIGDNCSVGSHSVVQHSRLGTGVVIGELVNLGVLPLSKYDYRDVGKNIEPVVVVGDNSIIRSHTSIYAKTRFGSNLNCGHGVRIRECTIVGKHTSIGTNTQIEGFCEIGDNVLIHTNAHIGQFSRMEDETYLAPGTVLTNTPHPLCPEAKQCLQGCILKKGAKVAVNVVVAPRVVIGENALVGAGAVVISDVEPNALVVGVPAKKIKDVREITCPYGLIDKPYR